MGEGPPHATVPALVLRYPAGRWGNNSTFPMGLPREVSNTQKALEQCWALRDQRIALNPAPQEQAGFGEKHGLRAKRTPAGHLGGRRASAEMTDLFGVGPQFPPLSNEEAGTKPHASFLMGKKV